MDFEEKAVLGGILFTVAWFLGSIGVTIGLCYAVFHFIAKYW